MENVQIQDSKNVIIDSVTLPTRKSWKIGRNPGLVRIACILLFLAGTSIQGFTAPDQISKAPLPPKEEIPKPLRMTQVHQSESVPEKIFTPEKTVTKPSSEILARGASLYQEHCARCHGVKGDGKGELAADLNPRPADLAAGVYKFRSTPSGALPTDEDLFRTLLVGVPGTTMSDYQDLTAPERQTLVSYLKNLSPRFVEEPLVSPIQFPEPRGSSNQALARGQQVFSDMFCAACHGESGKGDGPLAEELSDSEGVPIRPANLTKRPLKSGKNPEAIYRSVMTGLDGTPMPSYGDSLEPKEGWDLALYVFSLSESRGEK